jgi:hypothetical protein
MAGEYHYSRSGLLPGTGRRITPGTRRSEELQANRVLIARHRYTVDHPRSRLQIARERTEMKAIVRFPGLLRDHPGSAVTYVLGNAFLSRRAQIQTGQIDSHLKGLAVFNAFKRRFHWGPVLLSRRGEATPHDTLDGPGEVKQRPGTGFAERRCTSEQQQSPITSRGFADFW